MTKTQARCFLDTGRKLDTIQVMVRGKAPIAIIDNALDQLGADLRALYDDLVPEFLEVAK